MKSYDEAAVFLVQAMLPEGFPFHQFIMKYTKVNKQLGDIESMCSLADIEYVLFARLILRLSYM